ncbi:hypothetical protein SH661x_003162 [Planctomicrobium sp. SH661]|uniref:hypothetical protein n=1 Tax=Planctomicrobium sp. SH661 TaxID=3448124 RepID=UPI003F5B1FD8
MKHQICSLLFFACIVGCGGGSVTSLPDMVPVTGTVSYKGQPLTHGEVFFTPVDAMKGHASFGKIKDGKFTMTTTSSSPGAKAGKYQVAIVSREIAPQTEADVSAAPVPNAEVVLPKSLIPEKYSKPQTSGFEVDVAPGMAPLSYELKD